ncbi:MAG: threonylcarbamoyl-AMP synthase [Clostridia bacterium]|nr:threonylcarbamoyl-AMP synthase [Clostridia bacterium]
MTKYYDWKEEIKKEELKQVTEILANDGIIVFPTETVYGIGGNALSESVIDKVYDVKKRPREKALNIILADKADIEKYANIKYDIERKIIEKCMPGPITMILEKKEQSFGDTFTQDDNTIGIRIPDSKIIHTILENVDFPLIAPSANISGKPGGVEISDIKKDFDGCVDVIIDGGRAKIAKPSTIVKVINNEIVILREGEITKEDIIELIK